jgi:multimeric flavodoxin WrbA
MKTTIKNVLIISASPRKGGNSDLLCDQFLNGAQDAGHKAEKITLRERKINYCLACDGCKKNGGTCIQKDGAAEVLEKMIAADVLVLATPVYFYTMNAQMKALIDRTYAKYPNLGTKDVYIIVAAADSSKEAMERTIEGFRGFTSCYSGLAERGIVYGTGAWNIGDIRGSRAMDEAYAMGKNA